MYSLSALARTFYRVVRHAPSFIQNWEFFEAILVSMLTFKAKNVKGTQKVAKSIYAKLTLNHVDATSCRGKNEEGWLKPTAKSEDKYCGNWGASHMDY
jgi:hypothetical protein